MTKKKKGNTNKSALLLGDFICRCREHATSHAAEVIPGNRNLNISSDR